MEALTYIDGILFIFDFEFHLRQRENVMICRFCYKTLNHSHKLSYYYLFIILRGIFSKIISMGKVQQYRVTRGFGLLLVHKYSTVGQ